MTLFNRKKIELLAPAGSLQSFYAAMENGADAVFCGLNTFSARAKAKNFTLDEVELLSGYVHEKGKKIYVALNTLVKEKELPDLVDVLLALNQFQVDGLIIQDLGLYHLAKRHFSDLPLHASTQMTVHNSAGVRMLEKMGFSRAVLARELTLQEIGYIRRHSSMELEHFVHGALCYSISGHCLFSSYIDGKSGNRGRCAQPCRRRYSHQQKSGFYFSTSDFEALDLIPSLIGAGITSFKIEGRMKSPEYVATVVAAYRMVIDASKKDRKEAVAEARILLKNAMGRKSTQGFLSCKKSSDIVIATHKGGLGLIIGKVEQVRGKSVSFRTDDVIHVGDRLRIQSGNDRSGIGFTVRTLYLGNKKVKRANKGAVVSIPLPGQGHVKPRDTVFKLSTGKMFTMSEERAQKKLLAAPLLKTGVDIYIQCKDTDILVQASVSGNVFEKAFPVEMQLADSSPLTEEMLYKVFLQTGQKLLSLKSLHAYDLPPVVIKPSRLKAIRRDFYTSLLFHFLQNQQKQMEEKRQKVKGELQVIGGIKKKQVPGNLFLVVDSFDELERLSESSGVQFVLVLSPQIFSKWEHNSLTHNLLQERVTWDIPSVVFDEDWPNLKETVEKAIYAGFRKFRLNNLAHIEFFQMIPCLQLWAGPWLYTMNSQSLKTTQELGIQYHCLTLEDDKENLTSLLATDIEGSLAITVYAPVDLFTSRIKASFAEEESSVQNDQGELFQVSKMQDLTITRAPKPFSLLGKVAMLREKGCCNFIMDMRGVGLQSIRGQEILQAFYDDRSLQETIHFNFERGLQ